jgi:hypothetical protein
MPEIANHSLTNTSRPCEQESGYWVASAVWGQVPGEASGIAYIVYKDLVSG